jgi:hypothetical protein
MKPLHIRISVAGVLLALVFWGGGALARDDGRKAPIIDPTSWSDTLDDPSGLTWLENTLQLDGQVNLSPMESLSDEVGLIQSLGEGSDGVFYLGTDEARLWTYDPLSGSTTDLGTPVPGECDT